MKEIRTEIEIDASAEYVWRMLTDFSNYSRWNPLILDASGDIKPGGQLKGKFGLSGKGKTFQSKILKVEPNRELHWRKQFLLPGLFDTEYVFAIEPIGPNRVRFIQREIFSGLLTPLFIRGVHADTQYGLEEMNQTVKILAEHERFSKVCC